MLDPQNHDGVRLVVDLVDHPVVASAGGVHPSKLPYQGLPDTTRCFGDWPDDRLERGRPDLARQPVQVAEPFRRDLDLMHARRLHMIAQAQPLTTRGLLARLLKRGNQFGVPQDLDRLLHRLQVVRTQQDERRPAVTSDHDARVLPLDPVGKLRQVGFRFR